MMSAAAEPAAAGRQRQPRPSAWDRRSPSTLLLLPGKSEPPQPPLSPLEAFFSDDGVGCNPDETSALIRMLDSRDAHFGYGGNGDGNDGDGGNINGSSSGGGGGGDERGLSREYRRAIGDCIAGWEDRLLQQQRQQQEEQQQEQSEQESEVDSLELLKVASAIFHLSEVYLLPHRRDSGYGGSGGAGGIGGDGSGGNVHVPGSVTADTVRYLRLNHMPDVLDAVGTTAQDVDDMISSDQPEHYNFDDDGGGLYWSLVEAYVVRGCLREAWALLTRHSAVRRASAAAAAAAGVGDGEIDDPLVAEDCAAFEALRSLMLNAPLPGGLDDVNDAGLDDGDVEEAEEGGEGDVGTVPGVPRRAYRLWDGAGSSSRYAVRGDYYYDDDRLPGAFQPRNAMAKHRTWSGAVTRAATTPGPVLNLTRRIPRLRRILAILRGRFEDVVAVGGGVERQDGGGPFRSWVEALCAELLYVRPGIRPDDVFVRAGDAMGRYGTVASEDEGGAAADSNTVEEIVLSVMRGDAGKAVLALNGFGGASGAALPATMTSLLCNLLISAGRVQPERLPYDLQTELLLSASSSILSSFATQSHSGVGVRLSTRLLLAHAEPDNVRVTATLSETLGRHWPRTDAEARDLLALCDGLLRRGSVRVAEACDSLAYCRYRHYVADGRPGGAIHWLLRGVEGWTKLPAPSSSSSSSNPMPLVDIEFAGSCGRRFVVVCTETARATLRELAMSSSPPSDGGEALVHHHQTAKEVLESIMESDMAHLVRRQPAVELLRHVFDITTGATAGREEETARNIIGCLNEREYAGGDGTVKILAPPSMHADLLSVALDVLEREDMKDADGVIDGQTTIEKAGASSSSAFDVDGIHALMARFTQLTFNASLSPESLRVGIASKDDASKSKENWFPFEVERMRLALCKGLMRAFVAENANKKNLSQLQDGRLDAGIGKSVELMLGPSM